MHPEHLADDFIRRWRTERDHARITGIDEEGALRETLRPLLEAQGDLEAKLSETAAELEQVQEDSDNLESDKEDLLDDAANALATVLLAYEGVCGRQKLDALMKYALADKDFDLRATVERQIEKRRDHAAAEEKP